MKEKLFKVFLHGMWANAQKRSFNTLVETIITGDLCTKHLSIFGKEAMKEKLFKVVLHGMWANAQK